MSHAMMYRRSLTYRASFHAKNAFSGVSTGKALASRRGGNGVVNRARTATLYALRMDDRPKQVIRAKFLGPRGGNIRLVATRSHRQPSAKAFDLNTTMWTAFCVAGLQYCRSCPIGISSRFGLPSTIALSLMGSLRAAVRAWLNYQLASMFTRRDHLS